MKKFIYVFMFAVIMIVLSSCFESGTTLEFSTFPDSVYFLEGSQGQIPLSEVKVKIDGVEMDLNAAIAQGASVTGTTYTEVGYHTIVIKYRQATISFTYFVDDGTTNDDENYEIDWYGEEPQANHTYYISSAADLRGLSRIVNGSAKKDDGETLEKDNFSDDIIELTQDIDLSGFGWTPIGEGTRREADGTTSSLNNPNTTKWTYFSGVFDGKGHTITGLTDMGYTPSVAETYLKDNGTPVANGYVFGLFGLTHNATVRNVKMSNVQILGVSSYNVDTGEYVVYNGDAVGAIIGYAAGDVVVTNCEVLSGSILSTDAAGGIIGRAYELTSLTVTSCKNYADVTVTLSNDVKVAGIVGIASFKASVTTNSVVNISNNINYGTITISNNHTEKAGLIGGIISSAGTVQPGWKASGDTEGFILNINNENYGQLCFNSEFNKLGSNTYSVTVWDHNCIIPDCNEVGHHLHQYIK